MFAHWIPEAEAVDERCNWAVGGLRASAVHGHLNLRQEERKHGEEHSLATEIRL